MTREPSPAAWKRDLEAMRRAKDDQFRLDPSSPIPAPLRSAFAGLTYFPPDPAWRVPARFGRAPRDRPVLMETTRHAPPAEYERYAIAMLSFPGGGTDTVALFTPADEHRGHAAHEPKDLFLPFRDATSGNETYGAGRYLEVENPLEPGRAEADGVIDFNLAYHPWCAYSDDYVCPLPPRENWLKVAVEAGERSPPELTPP